MGCVQVLGLAGLLLIMRSGSTGGKQIRDGAVGMPIRRFFDAAAAEG
jgi:hypothetical protein